MAIQTLMMKSVRSAEPPKRRALDIARSSVYSEVRDEPSGSLVKLLEIGGVEEGNSRMLAGRLYTSVVVVAVGGEFTETAAPLGRAVVIVEGCPVGELLRDSGVGCKSEPLS